MISGKSGLNTISPTSPEIIDDGACHAAHTGRIGHRAPGRDSGAVKWSPQG